jgi:hypothetical protein
LREREGQNIHNQWETYYILDQVELGKKKRMTDEEGEEEKEKPRGGRGERRVRVGEEPERGRFLHGPRCHEPKCYEKVSAASRFADSRLVD